LLRYIMIGISSTLEVPFVLNPFARLLMILRQETGNNNSLSWWCAKFLMHCDEVNHKQGPFVQWNLSENNHVL